MSMRLFEQMPDLSGSGDSGAQTEWAATVEHYWSTLTPEGKAAFEDGLPLLRNAEQREPVSIADLPEIKFKFEEISTPELQIFGLVYQDRLAAEGVAATEVTRDYHPETVYSRGRKDELHLYDIQASLLAVHATWRKEDGVVKLKPAIGQKRDAQQLMIIYRGQTEANHADGHPLR